jgi:hypothetical protein
MSAIGRYKELLKRYLNYVCSNINTLQIENIWKNTKSYTYSSTDLQS